MSIGKEFATIDLLLASEAETRGVDAFALAVLKAERQMRRLFTHLVFQYPAFGSRDVGALRDALADQRNLYFEDFLSAWARLYPKSIKDIVGQDHDRLRAILGEVAKHRNKIFHGQLTRKGLPREELLAYVEHIRNWCRALGTGTQAEIGYDGFARYSFRKAIDPALTSLLVAKIASVQDYQNLLAEMDEERKERQRNAQRAR